MTQMQTNPYLRQDTSEDFTGQHFYKWKNGESYQGEFYNNTFHGKGIYTWPDNISYSGFFYVNKRHGYGKQEFADGRAYTGLYLDDKQYGVGIITYPNGTEDVGYWKGDLLVRLCSTHPSIPPFNEIAIGYTAGPEKMRKSIDMLADLRKTNAVDEYLDDIELGSKFTPAMKETLYASCVINPDSVFFNQNLFTRLFMRSLAIEKKQLIVKGPQRPRVEVEIGTKSTGPTSTPKTTKDISTTADQSKTKRKSKDSKPNLQNSQDTQTEDLHPVPSSVDTSVTTGRKQSRRSSTPELEDTKPDYPSVIQSWNSNPQHIELQKHTVRYQHFLAVTGFPMDKLMSCSREHLRPPGEVEAASNKLLQLAVEGDMRAITQLFVNESVYPDVSDGKGNTALLAATMWCHNDLIHCLLDMGADVNHCNDMGFGTLASLLVQLCPFGNLVHNINSIRTNTEDLLLECSTSPAEKIPDPKAKKTVGLYEMASLTRLPASQRHTKGSIVEESRSTSRKQAQKSGTPVVSTKSTTVPSKPLQDIIIDVCKPKKGNPSKEELLKTLKLLLGRGASINSVAVPLPPIFMAIRANEVSLLEMLLDSGGSPNLYHQEKDWGRLVPLHLTCSLPLESAIPFTTLLLKYGANPDLPTEDERSGQAETEEVFTSSVPSDKAFPTDGLTPLLIAASRPDLEGALELVKLLLQHKCNPSPPLYSGHSPLSLSIANGYSKVAKTLLAAGADPNRSVSEDLGPIVAAVLTSQWNHRWSIRKRIDIINEMTLYNVDFIGPFKLGKSIYEDKKYGTLVDYLSNMYSRESREGKSSASDEDKQMILEIAVHFTREAVRKVITYNRNLMIQRLKLIEELSQKKLIDCITFAVSRLPPKKMPLEVCYECCKSYGLTFHSCTRCYSVLYCSKYCQGKAWDIYHKDECFTNDDISVSCLRRPGERTPISVEHSSQTVPSSRSVVTKSSPKRSDAKK